MGFSENFAEVTKFTFADFEKIIDGTTSRGFPLASLPYVKEYMFVKKGMLPASMETILDKIMDESGTILFSTLPEEVLLKSSNSKMYYILAKKYFSEDNLDKALMYLGKIDSKSTIYPFALHLLGVISSLKNNESEARNYYSKCVEYNDKKYVDNKNYCQLAMARSFFNEKKYLEAQNSYNETSKKSSVWPEQLYEEAWNQYYLKNYNRSLGKLVSYKSPLLDFVFIPGVFSLTSLSYLKMCHYTDAQKEVDSFYSKFSEDTKKLKNYIVNNKDDYRPYYNLIIQLEGNKSISDNSLINKLTKTIHKESAYVVLKETLLKALKERDILSKKNTTSEDKRLNMNIDDVVDSMRQHIGYYVLRRFKNKLAEMEESFEGMSSIKLSLLDTMKQKVYANESLESKRGDVKYIKRNKKQYFWNFRGEFWADELGDYVFALPNNCIN